MRRRTTSGAIASFSPMPKSSSLPLGMVGQRLALGPLDLLELVDRGAFAVIGPADAVGEQRLEVGVGHGNTLAEVRRRQQSDDAIGAVSVGGHAESTVKWCLTGGRFGVAADANRWNSE